MAWRSFATPSRWPSLRSMGRKGVDGTVCGRVPLRQLWCSAVASRSI
jgi:hypothetical protein